MSEIKTSIESDSDGNFLITEDHTIADIARWVIAEGWLDDFLWCIKEEMGGKP